MIIIILFMTILIALFFATKDGSVKKVGLLPLFKVFYPYTSPRENIVCSSNKKIRQDFLFDAFQLLGLAWIALPYVVMRLIICYLEDIGYINNYKE